MPVNCIPIKTNSKNSSAPPSGDGFKKEKNKPAKNKKKGKKRKQGGQMGRKGIARQLLPLSEVDHIEVVSPLKEGSVASVKVSWNGV